MKLVLKFYTGISHLVAIVTLHILNGHNEYVHRLFLVVSNS